MSSNELTYEQELADLVRSLEDSHEEAIQNGCVPSEEVARSSEEAILLGLKMREVDETSRRRDAARRA